MTTNPEAGFDIDTTEGDELYEADTLAELEGGESQTIAPPNPLGRPLLYRLRRRRTKKGKWVAIGPFMKSGGQTEEGRRLPSIPISQPWFEAYDTDPDFAGQSHKFELVPGQLNSEEKEVIAAHYEQEAEARAQIAGNRRRDSQGLAPVEAAEKRAEIRMDRKLRAVERKIDKTLEAIPSIVAQTIAEMEKQKQKSQEEPPKGGS